MMSCPREVAETLRWSKRELLSIGSECFSEIISFNPPSNTLTWSHSGHALQEQTGNQRPEAGKVGRIHAART